MVAVRRRVGLVATCFCLVGAGLFGVACGDDDEDGAEGTLGGVESATSRAAPSASSPGAGGGAAREGFISLHVRVAVGGIDEEISLDRATVDPATLDPISLDAVCTGLDGADGANGLTVSVVDMRRVSTGNRLVSAALRVDGDVAGPGEYQGTLAVGDNQQAMTSYAGLITVDATLTSGSFDMADSAGQAATGTFTCAEEAVAPATTTIPTTTIPIATS